jgi:hypothetical protein
MSETPPDFSTALLLGAIAEEQSADEDPEIQNLKLVTALIPTLYDPERRDTPDFRRFCVGCGFEHGPVYPDCVWEKDYW